MCGFKFDRAVFLAYSGKKWGEVEQCGGAVLSNFRGITSINVDSKGRLAMPVRYRDQLLQETDGRVVITIDTEERCLLLYPFVIWESIEKKIEALSSFDPRTRRIQRLLIGHATETELDSSGRILLPQLLREYASLDKCVMLVGQGKKFEIWDEGVWNSGRDQWIAKGLGSTEELPEVLKNLSL